MGQFKTDTAGAAPAVTSHGLTFCTGKGQYETRKGTADPYEGISGKQIAAMVKEPPSGPKDQAQWFIPSTYKASDARVHEIQRKAGEFWFLPLDEDGGNLTLDEIEAALVAVCGDCVRMIYTSRSSTPERRKWRALIPLWQELAGSDYADTVEAFNDLLVEAAEGALIPDRALERPGQLVYLPNAGEHYESRARRGDRLHLTADHPIIARREAIRAKRAKAEAEARAGRERRKAKASADPGGAMSIVEAFNANHDLTAELERHGYSRKGQGRDWRSPYSTTGSYAVRAFDGFWISLSASDAAAGIGNTAPSGARIGDAFDLFVHFDHAGDFKAAVRDYAKEIGEDHRSKAEKAEPEPERGAEMFSVADLAGQTVPQRRWLVPELIPMDTVTLFSGDGGTGKSLLALQLAAASVGGGAWMGLAVNGGPAMVVSAEDDKDELHRRFADISSATGKGLGAFKDLCAWPLAGQDALMALMDGGTGALKPSPLYHRLDGYMASLRPAVLVLDTSADLYPGNENDRAQVRQFIGLLRRLALRHRCAVVLLSHPSLTGISSGTGQSGSTAWHNSVRSRLYLERIVQDGYEPDTKARKLSNKKANYGPTGIEITMKWQDGVFVADAPVTGLDRVAASAKAERVFLKMLRQFTDQGRHVNANGGPTYAPKVFAESTESEGITKRAFKAAMDALFHAGKIRNQTTGPATRRSTFIALAD